jgi:hypothetical protein
MARAAAQAMCVLVLLPPAARGVRKRSDKKRRNSLVRNKKQTTKNYHARGAFLNRDIFKISATFIVTAFPAVASSNGELTGPCAVAAACACWPEVSDERLR